MHRMAFFLGTLFALLSLNAAQVSRPSPSSSATAAGSHPILHWSWDEPNILENGSFEQGTNGWTLPREATVVTNTPSEGTNALRIIFGALSREIAVPSGGPWTLSFGVRDQFSDRSRVSIQIRDTDNQLLKADSFAQDGVLNFSTPRYAFRYVDLTPFAGRTVKFILNVADFDRVSLLVDDFRLTTASSDALFDIYFGARYLGRTNVTSMPVTNLPNLSYTWRVDAIVDGVTNTGPLWTFSVSRSQVATRFDVTPLPARICPDTPFTFSWAAYDNRDFRQFTSAQKFYAVADSAGAPSVLISEIDTGTADGVECINVSTNTIDLSGWRLQLFRTFSTFDGAGPTTLTIPTNSILAPGAIFTYRESPTITPWPHMRLPLIDWGDTLAHLSAGVILRDRASNVVDCVFIDQSNPNDRMLNGSINVPLFEWRGPIISDVETNKTYQRKGNLDHNDMSDWILAPASMKTLNPSLQIPFAPGLARIEATFGDTNTLFSTVSVAFPNRAFASARLFVSDSSSRIWGVSQPFEIVPADKCLTIAGPADVIEGAGHVAGAVNVQLSAPADEDVVVQVRASDPRIVINSATIPQGASGIPIDLTVQDDQLLQGTNLVTLIADAPGYSLSTTTLRIADNETATLQIVGPDKVIEGPGELTQFLIQSSVPPANDIKINLQFQGFGFSDTVLTLRAGQTNTPYIFSDDSSLQPEPRVGMTASFENWTPATVEIAYVDDERPIIHILGERAVIEGAEFDLIAALGGYVDRDVVVSLTSSDPQSVTVPEQVTIPAGANTVQFPIQFTNNENPTHDRPVVISASAPLLIGTNVTLTILDDDAASFEILGPVGPWSFGRPLPLKIEGRTADGRWAYFPIRDFTFSVTDTAGNTALPFTLISQPTFTNEMYVASLAIERASPNARIRFEQGNASGSFDIRVWESQLSNLADVVYHAPTDRLIVHDFNAISAIDAETGAASQITPPIIAPVEMVISKDGNTLYAIGDDGAKLHRVDLQTLQSISWPVDPTGQFIARSIAIVPNSPGTLIVRRSGPIVDLAKYQDGAFLNSIALDSFKFAGATSIFVDENSHVFVVGAVYLDVHHVTDLARLGNYSFTYRSLNIPQPKPAFGDNLLFFPGGAVFDPMAGGEYSHSEIALREEYRATAFDPATHRFARLNNFVSPRGTPEVVLLEPLTFRQLTYKAVHHFGTNSGWALAPAGRRGWAAILGGDLQIVPQPSIPAAAQGDLTVTATTEPYLESARVMRAKVRVKNSSPNTATNVLLSFVAPERAVLLDEPARYANGVLLNHAYAMGDLAPNETREYTFDLTAQFTPLMRAAFFVSSSAAESNYEDNRAYVEQPLSNEGPPPPPRLRLYYSNFNVSLYAEDEPGWDFILQRAQTPVGPWEDLGIHRVFAPSTRQYLTQFWITDSSSFFFRLKRAP